MTSDRRESPWPRMILGLCLLLTIVTVSSCKKKPPVQPPLPPPVETAPAPAPEKKAEVVEEAAPKTNQEPPVTESEIDSTIRQQNASHTFLKTVYFEFDKSEIRDDQIAVLRSNAAWLKSNPKYKVLIEGHCDERGTIEYNLALGDKRAKRVHAYLVDLGVASDRMRTISYGKERPADPGHDEDAWNKNRRAEFVLEK